MNSEYINIEKVCLMTGWSKQTVYCYLPKLIKQGLTVYRFGRFLRFREDEVRNFINQMTVPAYRAGEKPSEIPENTQVLM
jgi:predicted DNA-binding transcriptional regulator AlpA